MRGNNTRRLTVLGIVLLSLYAFGCQSFEQTSTNPAPYGEDWMVYHQNFSHYDYSYTTSTSTTGNTTTTTTTTTQFTTYRILEGMYSKSKVEPERFYEAVEATTRELDSRKGVR